MTPKEKADRIVSSFEIEMYDIEAVDGGGWDNCRIIEKTVIKAAIQCAIIAVDEIIASIPTLPNDNNKLEKTTAITYWVEVKNELLKQQNNG